MNEFQYCPMCRTALVSVERGGALRRACSDPQCGFVAWNNPAPVVGAIVEQDGHVILVRSHGWPENYYGLVAGFVETGESPRRAALREVAEEIGIEAVDATYIGTYPFAERNQLIFVYHVEVPDATIRLCEQELAGYRAVPIARVIPWSRGTGPALRDWLASRGFEREPVDFGQHMQHLHED